MDPADSGATSWLLIVAGVVQVVAFAVAGVRGWPNDNAQRTLMGVRSEASERRPRSIAMNNNSSWRKTEGVGKRNVRSVIHIW